MIEITGLTRRFGPLTAVDGLTLTVADGEIFALLGPNGAGKTTTIRLLTGLLKPDSGGIILDGIDSNVDPIRARTRIGYVPDIPYIYENLTGREFLEFVGRIYGVSEAALERGLSELGEVFGLAPLLDRLGKSYSHGFRQRLVIAAALIHEPGIIVMDEPMVGLDPASARLVKNILIRERARGKTVLVSTHTLSLAEEIADRIGVMRRGKLVALGSPEAIRGEASLEEAFLSKTGGGDVGG
ncbi:MAG TPA: ABC transporter ATP-binding protein [bacterium]|nr:ABC transporter ATP-binding protein [bacterium]HPQ67031.1 ABC transporter ATP-binding protein [bacterium]